MKKFVSITLTLVTLFGISSVALAAENIEIIEAAAEEAVIAETQAVPEALQISDAQAELLRTDLPFKPGQILVGYTQSSQMENAAELCGTSTIQTIHSEYTNPIALVQISTEDTVQSAIDKFMQMPGVEFAQPNYIYKLETAATPTDPLFSKQWYFDKIQTGEAWDIVDEIEGKKVRVAILDGLPQLNHPDLEANVNKSLARRATMTGVEEVGETPFHEHGTHVAGIIAGTANNGIGIAGVAAGSSNQVSEIIAVDLLNGGITADSTMVIHAMDWAIKCGVKVINMSFGSKAMGEDFAFERMVNVAADKGILSVCAAGNDNNGIGSYYPADFDNAVGVIATTNYKDVSENSRASFSNYGNSKDISAPGENIYSAYLDGGYTDMNGTSMAAPVVSAVAAMMYYVNPDLTARQARYILMNTATDLYTPGFDSETAWGNVNAVAAVKAAAGQEPEPTDLPAPQNFIASEVSYDSVALAWDDVAGAEGYAIYRSKEKDGGFRKIHTTLKTKFTDTNGDLAEYSYYVRAYTTSNGNIFEGKASKIDSAKFWVAEPANFKAQPDTKGIKLSWKKPRGVSGYILYRSTKPKSEFRSIVKLKSSNTVSYMDKTAADGRKYYYKLLPYRTVDGYDYRGHTSRVISGKRK